MFRNCRRINTLVLLTCAIAVCGSVSAQNGKWSLTSDAPGVARFRQKAVTLTDGRVLLIGGQIQGSGDQLGTPACDIYDPVSQTFVTTDSMSVGRYEHAAVRLADGRVLTTGGVSGYGSAMSSGEIFDPESGIWTTIPPLPAGVSGHEMVLLPNGTVLLAGGGNYIFGPVYAACYLFDPAANSGAGGWTSTGSMNVPRMGFHLVVLENGLVLTACGRISSSDFGGTVQTELYNPTTGTWSFTGNMVQSRGAYSGPASTATRLKDGKVLVTGGDSSAPGLGTMYSQTEVYNPSTGTWSAGPSMPAPRQLHEAVLLGNAQVLIAGGRSTGGSHTQSSIVLDPATMTWREPRPMVTSREVFSLSLLPDGTVLAPLGSAAGAWTPNPDAEIYDPSWLSSGSKWKLKENYRETVVCEIAQPCSETYYGTLKGSFESASGTSESLTEQIESGTVFQFRIGDLVVEDSIGSDPNYEPGDTKAALTYTAENGKAKRILAVKLSWKKGVVRVTLKGVMPHVLSPVAAGRAGLDDYPLEEKVSVSFRNGSARIFSWGGTFAFPSTIKRTIREVNGITFELDKIRVKGTCCAARASGR